MIMSVVVLMLLQLLLTLQAMYWFYCCVYYLASVPAGENVQPMCISMVCISKKIHIVLLPALFFLLSRAPPVTFVNRSQLRIRNNYGGRQNFRADRSFNASALARKYCQLFRSGATVKVAAVEFNCCVRDVSCILL